MDKRIAKNTQVEIIDSESPYFGKTGEVMTIMPVLVKMLREGTQKEEFRIQVKLDDTGEFAWFLGHQLEKVK